MSSTATGAFIVSGGGFSVYAGRPKYQDTVVAKYLKNATALPASSTFNSTGRGYPDVAGLAHNYYIEMGGELTSVDGTSCSTPVWGGALACVPLPLSTTCMSCCCVSPM